MILRIVPTLLLGALLGTSATAGEWTQEKPKQVYLLVGCGPDSNRTLATINTGSHKYLAVSGSDVYRTMLSIGIKSVVDDLWVKFYAFPGFTETPHMFLNQRDSCQLAEGIEVLGIQLLDKSSSGIGPRSFPTNRVTLHRRGDLLEIRGSALSWDLLDLEGRSLGHSRPHTGSIQAIPLGRIPRGVLLVRSGSQTLRFTNF